MVQSYLNQPIYSNKREINDSKMDEKRLLKNIRKYVRYSNLAIVKTVANSEGWNIHVFDEEVLRQAAKYNIFEIVQYLVEEEDSNVDAYQRQEPYNHRETALTCAAGEGQLEMVKYLVSRGANPRIFKDKAMRNAACRYHFSVVLYLIEEHGADICAWTRDHDGTVFQTYLSSMQDSTYKFGAYLIKEHRYWEKHPNKSIFFAAHCGDLDTVQYLLQNGVNVNGNGVQFPLFAAAAGNHVETVKCLLDNGANPNLQNNCTLGVVILRGHMEVFKCMLQNKCFSIWTLKLPRFERFNRPQMQKYIKETVEVDFMRTLGKIAKCLPSELVELLASYMFPRPKLQRKTLPCA